MQLRKDLKSIILSWKIIHGSQINEKKLYLHTWAMVNMQNSLKKIIFEMQFLHRKCSDANAFHLFSKGRCFLKDRRTKCFIQMPNYHKKYEILIRYTHSPIDFLRKSRNGSLVGILTCSWHQKTNSPIHEFKVLHKSQRAF